MAKVIENGVSLGVNFNSGNVSKYQVAGSDLEEVNKNIEQWNLDEEVAKIIETGRVLGFDFNSREEEVKTFVARREMEDKERSRRHEALTWNIRGLGGMEKKKAIKHLVNKHRPTILFIQESKLSSFDSKVISSLGGSWLNRGLGVDAIGRAGGLITMWNDSLFVTKACIKNDRCIILAG
ncbi:hypothetical protein Dsin_026039 [Dipteronia sinensis]|uniref:Endonuclease/exonuclease/phosphatase domain-containing protein n=1 Tax=Dipteronia sinensis TaxID=43782 RepID=A0AAD9ZY19_9ROSI|nr:hypothetical protein Dsin_026039 [Dipteronia sinensis]